MRWSGSSYIGSGRQRQSPPFMRPVAVALLAAALGGCAGLGLPFESASNQKMTTGSIHKVSAKTVSTKVGGNVDQSDWETVRRAVATIAGKEATSDTVDWRNPDTGSTGTIAILGGVTAANDESCRNFATTINDMRGIRRYRGEACRMTNGRWQLFGVLADDSQLL
jgi:surface antigen